MLWTSGRRESGLSWMLKLIIFLKWHQKVDGEDISVCG